MYTRRPIRAAKSAGRLCRPRVEPTKNRTGADGGRDIDLIAAADALSARICFTVLLNCKPTAQEVAAIRDCAKKYETNVDEGESRSRCFAVAREQRAREDRSPGHQKGLTHGVYTAVRAQQI
jgi:hypothetical protein